MIFEVRIPHIEESRHEYTIVCRVEADRHDLAVSKAADWYRDAEKKTRFQSEGDVTLEGRTLGKISRINTGELSHIQADPIEEDDITENIPHPPMKKFIITFWHIYNKKPTTEHEVWAFDEHTANTMAKGILFGLHDPLHRRYKITEIKKKYELTIFNRDPLDTSPPQKRIIWANSEEEAENECAAILEKDKSDVRRIYKLKEITEEN